MADLAASPFEDALEDLGQLLVLLLALHIRSQFPFWSLQAGENSGGFCKNGKHVAGVLDGRGIGLLVRPGYGGSRHEPNSRTDDTKITQRPELVPAHCGHGFVEVPDRVLPLLPGGGLKGHDNRRTKRVSVHRLSPTIKAPNAWQHIGRSHPLHPLVL